MRVTDLIPLANVHKLIVSECQQATNFSSLVAVVDLSIHRCRKLALEDLPFLFNFPKLSLIISLTDCVSDITSLSSQNLTVDLTCVYLTDEDLNNLINVQKSSIKAS